MCIVLFCTAHSVSRDAKRVLSYSVRHILSLGMRSVCCPIRHILSRDAKCVLSCSVRHILKLLIFRAKRMCLDFRDAPAAASLHRQPLTADSLLQFVAGKKWHLDSFFSRVFSPVTFIAPMLRIHSSPTVYNFSNGQRS